MKNKNQIIFPAIVIDNKDPLLLGRIRAVSQLDNKVQIVQAVWSDALELKKTTKDTEEDIPELYKWTTRDPFLCLPLLPFFINQQPETQESVNIFYADKEFPYQNKYYVQGGFSSPVASSFESYLSSRKYTSQGTQVKPLPDIKKPGTDEYYNNFSKGVYPEPRDNAIIGRGTCDIIVKDDDVILRAGRNIPQKINQLPRYYDKRSFLQLSAYRTTENSVGTRKLTKITTGSPQVKFLLEWSIINPENNTIPNNFTGTIDLYQLKDNIEYLKNVEFTVDTQLNPSDITLVTSVQFNSLTKELTTQFINDTIKKLNNEGRITTTQGVTITLPNVFPLAFRPNKITYKWISTEDPIQYSVQFNNVSYIYSNVKLQPSDKIFGTGVLYTKNSFGKPLQFTNEEYVEKSVSPLTQTVGIMGGDKLVLLSHNSTIPSKGKINIDGTVYGISQELMNSEILPKTNSMVRGEELMDLLNLIVQFLTTHVHPFPGLPPVPVSTTGIQSQDILNKIRNAADNILNQNVRIN
jgi:hypothetical protein